jgi:hypothetical protein
MITIVAGPPCAGKSTYVSKNAKKGSVRFDFDLVHSAISGEPSHVHLEAVKPLVMAMRDALYVELEKNKKSDAWIITSTKVKSILDELVKRFDAKLVFLDVTREAAHARADQDNRPTAWHEYIDNWFDQADIDPKKQKKSGDEKMEKKIFSNARLKLLDEPGSFRAIFSVFDRVDKQNDLTKRGAFTDGQKVKVGAWGHAWGSLPVGSGVIHADDEKAWIDGKFFVETQGGKDTWLTVRGLGELQEWSYGYDLLDSEMGTFEGKKVRILKKILVWEVSPVFLGAGGSATRTTDIKSQGNGAGMSPKEYVKFIESVLDPVAIMDQIKAMGSTVLTPGKVIDQISALGSHTPGKTPPMKATRLQKAVKGLRAANPEATDFELTHSVHSLITAKAQELMRIQETTAGVIPDFAVCLDVARKFYDEVDDTLDV